MATSAFGKAFASARKAGKKEFTFNGKKYNTKTKEEAAAPTPAKRSMASKVRVPKGPQVTAKGPSGRGGKRGSSKGTDTRVADAKVKADAAREERTKKSKGSAANIGYAKRVTGRKAG